MTESLTLAEIAAREVRMTLAGQRRSVLSLATDLGVSDMYLSRRLNGHIPFDLADLERVAVALGVPVLKLLAPELVASGGLSVPA